MPAVVSPAKKIGPLSIGSRVNHFVVCSVLGEGGTAVVYEAVHTRLNATVALKVVDMRSPYGPIAALRLQREAELCAAVNDPHVPKIYDVGQLENGTPFIVMEKVSGPTLEILLARGRLGLALACAVLRDLLLAVEAVHRAGIVHRDIKPSNVIVQFGPDNQPNVRLMDFGVSRSLWHRPGDAGTVTRRGTITGTPEYMAPEQIHGQPVDARTDVYALGVVAYEMFAGRAPFAGGHPAEVITAVLRREFFELSSLRPELTPELALLVGRAMENQPEQRFANAEDMRMALDAWTCPATTTCEVEPRPSSAALRHASRVAPHRLALLTGMALATSLGLFSWLRCEVLAATPDPSRAFAKGNAIASEATPEGPGLAQAEFLPLFRENLAQRKQAEDATRVRSRRRTYAQRALAKQIVNAAQKTLLAASARRGDAAPSHAAPSPSLTRGDVPPNPYED